MAAKTACVVKIVYADRLCLSEMMALAERTMMSPTATSATVSHSRR